MQLAQNKTIIRALGWKMEFSLDILQGQGQRSRSHCHKKNVPSLWQVVVCYAAENTLRTRLNKVLYREMYLYFIWNEIACLLLVQRGNSGCIFLQGETRMADCQSHIKRKACGLCPDLQNRWRSFTLAICSNLQFSREVKWDNVHHRYSCVLSVQQW